MHSAELFLVKRIMELRAEDELRRAESERLARQARQGMQGLLSRQGCRLLGRLGHLLVVLGQRLQRYGLPQSFPLEGQMSESG